MPLTATLGMACLLPIQTGAQKFIGNSLAINISPSLHRYNLLSDALSFGVLLSPLSAESQRSAGIDGMREMGQRFGRGSRLLNIKAHRKNTEA